MQPRDCPSMEPLAKVPRLGLAVACVAASTLLLEITLTRLFSVLLLNHFSFFAVALAMSGLAFGGLWMTRRPIGTEPDTAFAARLAALALSGGGAIVAGLGVLLLIPEGADLLLHELAILVFVVGFTTSGAFLAAAFARRPSRIGGLYAADLLAAAAACVAAIFILRRVQGPAALLVPTLLLGLAATTLDPLRLRRNATVAVVVVLGGAVLLAAAHQGPLLRFRGAARPGIVVFERWNDYSRVQGEIEPSTPDVVWFVIDRSAATPLHYIPAAPGAAPHSEPWWDQEFQALAYHAERPIKRVAVIGVGGGVDLLAPLQAGVPEIVGFDLNRIFIDLLHSGFRGFNAVARRPEITLIHSEARTALRHERRHFDLIQASLIDTWAATAAGGFVLAENGLYTLEGWQTLLDRLSPTGVLTMTRWYIPRAPAEMQRLVALAATALEAAGLGDPRQHIVLAVTTVPERNDPVLGPVYLATILLSKTPFTAAELDRLRAARLDKPFKLLVDPRRITGDPVLAALLANNSRDATIRASPFDISPPTDLRPYFFLQVRPTDLALLLDRRYRGFSTEVTFNGVRVLLLLVAWTAFLALGVLWLGARLTSHRPAQGSLAAGTGYFFSIGLGYMLVQLGLHQRLTLLLGQPTYALSVVLFGLLLGTGLGAAAVSSLAPSGREGRAWALLLGAVAVVAALFPAVPLLDDVGPTWPRLLLLVALLVGVGTTLGTAFPIGVRMMAPHGSGVVQRMWAVNGAASIAGSALAALIGLAGGSRVVVLAGLGCYVAAAGCGWAARGEQVEDHVPPEPGDPRATMTGASQAAR